MNFLNQLMTNTLRIGLVSVTLGFGMVRAQVTPAPPTPDEPFLAKLPANSSWVLNYTPPSTDGDPSPAPIVGGPSIVSITVVRNGGLRRETCLMSDKSKTEKWVVKNIIFTQQKSGGVYGITSAELAGIDSNYPDFPQLVWIDKAHFQSVEDKNGKSCFLYFWSESGRAFRPIDSPLPIEPTKVWISVDSKLPVAIEDEHVKITFDYNLPVTALTLPAECRVLLSELANTNKRLDGQQMIRPQ
jgi:hypothetical protein